MLSKEFVTSRKVGKVAEYYVADLLEKRGYKTSVVPYGNHPAYDLTATKDREYYLVEVQWDKRAMGTGNLAIEIGKLQKSQADLLVIVFGTDKPLGAWLTERSKTLSYAQNWPRKGAYGEHGEISAIIPQEVFTANIVTRRLA